MSQTLAALIWALGIVMWTLIRFPHRRKAKRLAVVTNKVSKSDRLALGLSILGLVICPVVYLLTPWFDFANYAFSPLMGLLGTLVMAAFLMLFHLSHKHLSDNWSVSLEIRKDHSLVDTGVYRHIRHPMYTSFWLWSLAQFLLLPNWVAGLAGLLSIAWLYFNRIGKEEDMMRSQFGQSYDEYCKRTHRLIPKIY